MENEADEFAEINSYLLKLDNQIMHILKYILMHEGEWNDFICADKYNLYVRHGRITTDWNKSLSIRHQELNDL